MTRFTTRQKMSGECAEFVQSACAGIFGALLPDKTKALFDRSENQLACIVRVFLLANAQAMTN
jgi:hypothetical protein